MATKTNKTVGKTTKTIKKGDASMTATRALTKLMIDYNSYQEYRKNAEQSYNFCSKTLLQEFSNKILRPEELEQLVAAYEHINKVQYRLAQYIALENSLNRFYGREGGDE